MARRLQLKSERLAELSSDELAVMGGAQMQPPTPVPFTYGCKPTLDVKQCVAVQIYSGKAECYYPLLPTYYCTPMPINVN